MASFRHQEEKGTDVNLASHLLSDMFEQRIDAAVIVSNDSDLKLPVHLYENVFPSATPIPGEDFSLATLQVPRTRALATIGGANCGWTTT